MNPSPINDLLEVKAFLVAMTRAGIEAKQNDGKIDAKDLPLLGPPMMLLPAALDNIGDIGEEWKLLPENIEEFAGSVAADLGLDANGDVAFYTKEGIVILQSAYRIFKRVSAPKA